MTSPIKKTVVIGDCTLHLGDCLEVMPLLGKFDAILTDPPYETTQAGWDKALPFEPMWQAINGVANNKTPVCLFGMEPFSSGLRMSNLEYFKYDWIWSKAKSTGFLNAKKQPLRSHEFISVFYRLQCDYYPQKTFGHRRKKSRKTCGSELYGDQKESSYNSTDRYPRSIQDFSSDTQKTSLHPTQKPVDLIKYLLESYTVSKSTVLDFAMGSGTTGVACVKLGRKFTGIELDPDYFEIACQRIRDAYAQADLFVPAPSKPIKPETLTLDLDEDVA